MHILTVKELYLTLLQDGYDREQQLLQTLGKMADAAVMPELDDYFAERQFEARQHVRQLETVFALLSMAPQRNICEATQGMVKDAEELMGASVEEGVMDMGLIALARKMGHYGIASYGALCDFARTLDYGDQQEILRVLQEEEREADESLTLLADGLVKRMARRQVA